MSTNRTAYYRSVNLEDRNDSRFSDALQRLVGECAGEGWAAVMVMLAVLLAVVA